MQHIDLIIMFNLKYNTMENKACSCGADNKIVIACSGAADVGLISDQVSRKLSLSNQRKMSCLALFATCSDEMINDFKNKEILVIDGCNIDCGKKIMEQRGISDYSYLRITDHGFTKGKTLANAKNIQAVLEKSLAL